LATRKTASTTKHYVLDSSCWLEYLADTARADWFAARIEAPHGLVVPMISVYEVYKKLLREQSQETAEMAVALMQQGHIVQPTLEIHLSAAGNGLPLADSLIYATAQAYSAELWTQDAHFEGLGGVRFFSKKI
jgi:toxin FitB